MKELSKKTKTEMEAGQKRLRLNFDIALFTTILERALPLGLKGWRISDQTCLTFDEKYRVYVHVYPRAGKLIEFIEHEDDFPSDELIATIILLLC